MDFGSHVDVKLLSGLHPQLWICVGPGYSREDIKALTFEQGCGFVGDAITTIQDICLRILDTRSSVLGPLSRQEVLRLLLAEKRISARMPELKRLRRQGAFFKRLDQAIQAGRVAFAHEQEREVYSERLKQRLGENPVREEVEALVRAYETWLQANSLWDPPLVIRSAIERLSQGWPESVPCPKEIICFSNQTPESLEREFWDSIGRCTKVRRVAPETSEAALDVSLTWERWHTLDDSAEALAETLQNEKTFDQDVILIPDTPSTRRSLKRALESWNIPQADPRDPTRIRWDEQIKWALLPLEVVGRNYERQKVVAWLKTKIQGEFPAWIKEINSRGVRQGLNSYKGGMLSGAYSRLSELASEFGGRKTCAELSQAHLKHLRTEVGVNTDRVWLINFFEDIWKEFVADTIRIEQSNRKAPAYYWLERLQARISETPAPVEKFKAAGGVRVYRLHQAPIGNFKRVWIFGMPSQWFAGDGTGDYWFSEKEREILAGEFAVRSAIQVCQERVQALRAWVRQAEQVRVLDAQYDPDGRERESILPALKEVAAQSPGGPEEKGSHPRWSASYGAFRPLQPQSVKLPPLMIQPGANGPEISATELDRYSRCSFQALAYSRWGLSDIREPDAELWPESKGNILHEAVRILLASRDAQGQFKVLPREALEQAWEIKRPRGLLQGERVTQYVKSRMLLVLEAFCETEREYVKRAQTKVISIDETRFKLDFPKFSIVGKPDRIDEHPEGVFIMDYKSSADLPHGTDMIELGYRLQLPFYALAARKEIGKEVLGAQFIVLDRNGKRSSGVFLKKYNGKEDGKLTKTTANSKSLLPLGPDEVWGQFEQHVLAQAEGYVSGHFEAKPKARKKDKECSTCMIGDLCGRRRLQDTDEGDDASE